MCYFAGVDDPIPVPRCNDETIIAGKRQALISFFSKKSPARRPVRIRNSFGDLEGYVAVAAYYVDLLGRSDDGPALGANVLEATVLAGGAPAALYGDRCFFAVIVIIVALYLDLEGGLAAGGEILHAGLLGQPFGGLSGQGRYRPAIGAMMLNAKAVGFGGGFESLVVVVAVVAYILDLVNQVVKVGHLMKHGRSHLADGAVDVFGGDVDLAVGFVCALPDFVDAAPAVCTASIVGRYRDGRADQLILVEMLIEQVEHGFGLGYDLGNVNHRWCLLESYVWCDCECMDLKHNFKLGKETKKGSRSLLELPGAYM